MIKYKPAKGKSLVYLLTLGIFLDIFIWFILNIVNSYTLNIILKSALVAMTVYFAYYILLNLTLEYGLNKDELNITSLMGLKKITIPLSNIAGYAVNEGRIKAVSLSGLGTESFLFGKHIINKIGVTSMFVTSARKTIYIKTSDAAYGISPENINEMITSLRERGIKDGIEEFLINNDVHLYRDAGFRIPFILSTVIILVLTLNPFILYLNNELVTQMPLNFNAAFEPIQMGTGKQFAFKQMTYGVLNMILLFCMYYAAVFCAKYDKRLAKRYIFVSLVTSIIFLVLQMRILAVFN